MKKLVKKPVMVEKVVEKVTEEQEMIEEGPGGFDVLLGKKVLVLCNYFYLGILTGVNASSIELSSPSIVYETGEWDSTTMKDAQKLPCKKMYIQTDSIESFFEVA